MGDTKRGWQHREADLFKPINKVNKHLRFYDHTIFNAVEFSPAQAKGLFSDRNIKKGAFRLPYKIASATNPHTPVCAPISAPRGGSSKNHMGLSAQIGD